MQVRQIRRKGNKRLTYYVKDALDIGRIRFIVIVH